MSSFVSRTVGDVVSEMLMSRTAFSGSLLVLEGDDDLKFWRPRAEKEKCQFVLAGSKPTVTNSVVNASALNQIGILGVVDADYDLLLDVPIDSPHIVRTDTRDLETLMLASAAFDRVLIELADATKVTALEQVEKRSIKDALISRSMIFGELRYLSAQMGWLVDFDCLSPYRFTDVQTWKVDGDAFLREAVRQIPGMTPEVLSGRLRTVPPCDPWILLHGKDTLSVLAIGLRCVLGNHQHPVERISQMLRLAYDYPAFAQSQLFVAIANWETANVPYKVNRTNPSFGDF